MPLIDHEMAVHHGLYNWLRSKEERRMIYGQLRAVGITAPWARRVRDWSDYHREVFIENHLSQEGLAGTRPLTAGQDNRISQGSALL